MTPNLLLVEDDADFAQLLCLSLAEESFEVKVARDGETGLAYAQEQEFDLILLDLMLPEMSGLEVCQSLRNSGNHTPLLMLTARDSEIDRVLGLELGADDYLPKTMGVRELVARVRAAIRRSRKYVGRGEREGQDILQRGSLRLDPLRRTVDRAGETLNLTAKEFDLLWHFASHPGRVFRREDLLAAVWGFQYEGYQHTVNSHINRLRAKIEPDVREPQFLLTVWGVGYKFNDQLNLA